MNTYFHNKVTILFLASILTAGAGHSHNMGISVARETPEMNTGMDYGRCDSDGNGLVNIFDLLEILKQIPLQKQSAASDVDGSGTTNVFDLLEFLRGYKEMRSNQPQEFMVLASLGYGCLTGSRVLLGTHSTYVYENYSIKDTFAIYSNRNISRAEFTFDGITLEGTKGLSPAIVNIDLDSINNEVVGVYETEHKAWKIRAWDWLGNCAVDSGTLSISFFLYPVHGDGSTASVSLEIDFPLVLRGPDHRFGVNRCFIGGGSTGTFIVDLNRAKADSVVFDNSRQLAETIMDEIISNDSLWNDQWNSFDKNGPYVIPAVEPPSEEHVSRIVVDFMMIGGCAELVPVDSNEEILSAIGFPAWYREILPLINLRYRMDHNILYKYQIN